MSSSPTFSFEFFPPKDDAAAERLRANHARLTPLNPEFCSVTFGAGGSTQERTLGAVRELMASGTDTAPHLSCIGQTRDSVRKLLERYQAMDIRRMVTLRGDLPSGMGSPGELGHANELVAFIREETGSRFHLTVAAYPEMHPQAASPRADLKNFKRKVDAGADAAITQYFFNADAYFRFVDECEALGITIPVIPGIMPIANYAQLARFSEMCGAEIPRWVRLKLQSYGDDRASIRAFGREVVTALCERLLTQGVPGLHFYTMNHAAPVLALWRNLGLPE